MTAKNNMSIPMNFKEGLEDLIWTAGAGADYARPMPQRRFPRPWRFEPIYRVIDANGLALACLWRASRQMPSRHSRIDTFLAPFAGLRRQL